MRQSSLRRRLADISPRWASGIVGKKNDKKSGSTDASKQTTSTFSLVSKTGKIKCIRVSLLNRCCIRYLFCAALVFTLMGSLLISWILPSETEKYLLYYNHSGFSNQLLGIKRAAFLAMATNRTLVLPPILPHNENGKSEYNNQAYFPRASGRACDPHRRYYDFLKTVTKDVLTARKIGRLKSEGKAAKLYYPSFLDILDFADLTEHTGLKVMDMQEFAAMPFTTLLSYFTWCPSQPWLSANEMADMFVPGCEKSKGASFSQLVPFFEKICGRKTVALMGSAFIAPTVSADDTYFSMQIQDTVEEHTFGAMPSTKMLKLLGEIYSHLPEGYVSVHIRFGDFLTIKDCDDDDVKTAYSDVMAGLEGKNVVNGTHVLIGNGNTEAKRCFEHHAKGRYTVSTVNDIISNHTEIQDLVDGIHIYNGHIFLFLDLVLLSVAEHIVYAHAGINANSFQRQIRFRHDRRMVLLEKMALAMKNSY